MNKGAALLTVLILIIILTILSASILSLLSSQTRLIEHDIARAKAKYAAEATMVREFDYARDNSGAFESSHNVPGRYDQYSQVWVVNISSGPAPSPFSGLTELNFSVNYGSL